LRVVERGIGRVREMGSDTQNDFSALNEIRDNALMLNLGNAFLCEARFLKKIGLNIESNIEKLRTDIIALKKKYPGEFVHEVDTDAILEELHLIARRLQNPDRKIDDQCTTGELGRELVGHTRSLTEAVLTIRRQVEGEVLIYTRKDSLLDLASSVKAGASSVGTAVGYLFKILIGVVLVSIALFPYLFVTMEKEDTLLKQIALNEATLQEQKELLLKLEKRRAEIKQKIESMRRKAQSRQDKIDLLDLNVLIHNVNKKRNDAELEIARHERKIEQDRKKLEELRSKPFIIRLLRM